MKRIILPLVLLVFSFPAFSVSTVREGRDGIGRVTLKNGFPCLYVSHGKRIVNIQFSGQKKPEGFAPQEPDGSSRDKCVPFFDGNNGELKYNEPISASIIDESTRGGLKNAHHIYFCLEKQEGNLRLVQTGQEGGCSTEPWKPVKKYGSGFFGKLEQMWDKFFKLNGYTEEAF
ncbi:hypothetical protein [Neisseria sp.]|uniref:hypothetical protein n=1 Tax=Neisseria sp. TaxID=192066 RepID=UPI0026DD3D0E|nr:hypothetical protein [Neisseria sp.]MDO4907062.1 hypothetical protein [Neisseria sp.]